MTKTCLDFLLQALKVFKYDWSKVWQFCVPHRDPALLPRQWRIALGTQKSYKSNEINKEKRRLYEAGRRQAIAAQKDAFLDNVRRHLTSVNSRALSFSHCRLVVCGNGRFFEEV